MNGKEHVTLTLPRNDVGQLLDGIRARKEQWDNTVKHWQGGDVDLDESICESSDAEEAQDIADHYGNIIEQVEAQLSRSDDLALTLYSLQRVLHHIEDDDRDSAEARVIIKRRLRAAEQAAAVQWIAAKEK